MLETLDDIQWEKLIHAYGEATDIPEQIRALASQNKEVRDASMYQLYGNLWHQGTVYEATAYAVPFLVELLESSNVQDKDKLLFYLAHLANGNSYLDVHQHMEWAYPKEKRESQEFQQQLQKELGWVKSAHDAVSKSYETYLKLMWANDEETRMMAIFLLAGLPKIYELILPKFKQRLTEESSIPVKATIISMLPNILIEPKQADSDNLMSYTNDDNEPLIRFCAAETITRLMREKTPQSILEILFNALDGDTKLAGQQELLTWTDNNVSASVANTLCYIGFEASKPIIPRLIKSLETFEWISTNTIVWVLLYLLFNDKKHSDKIVASDLTELQKQALKAISEYALTMKPVGENSKRNINANVGNMLNSYGLPSMPEEIEEFLNNTKLS